MNLCAIRSGHNRYLGLGVVHMGVSYMFTRIRKFSCISYRLLISFSAVAVVSMLVLASQLVLLPEGLLQGADC